MVEVASGGCRSDRYFATLSGKIAAWDFGPYPTPAEIDT